MSKPAYKGFRVSRSPLNRLGWPSFGFAAACINSSSADNPGVLEVPCEP